MPDSTTSLAVGGAIVAATRTKAVEKLLDAVYSAIGKLYEPTHQRRMARAQGDSMLIIDDANAELSRRAEMRLVAVELRRQANIDAVVEEAIRSLPRDAEISDAPTDPDWMAGFFESCQDVSQPDLIRLFARLLAAEVQQPGACSRRTLDVLKNLTTREAATFAEVCGTALYISADSVAVPHGLMHAHDANISEEEWRALEECGLLKGSATQLTFVPGSIIRWGAGARIKLGPCASHLTCIVFTTAGRELARAAEANVRPKTREWILRMLRLWGCESVELEG
jgi:hypothetical protein